ncbi:choice-of-anchor tandem repeat NxxGxxAF-containing protein [Chitinimonas sp.]|uniref:choice-of-anchor tandem repeat NxxGxxAF-containing protein n=1 Tax=Chitinimonas sp. TaxID=1934313 RepID=UPI002F91C8C1
MRYTPYTLTIIAANDGRFVDFAPYVASITDQGVVAFQATLADGHSGVFTSDGAAISDVAVTTAADSPVQRFASHPDINKAGVLSVYGELQGGEEALLLYAGGEMTATGVQESFKGIGPLGPTMNEAGAVAFRGTLQAGQASIQLRHAVGTTTIAAVDEVYRGFDGLPVVNNAGQLAFRADLQDGRQGVFLHDGGSCQPVALTGEDFAEIARFPIVNDLGTVAFVATHAANGPGIYAATAGSLTCLTGDMAGFESFRGVLINHAGLVAFYGTPAGGQLGIYTGPDPIGHRLLGLGDTLFDGGITDLALNPVSVNEAGQLAIRIALADGRQFVLRADPAA